MNAKFALVASVLSSALMLVACGDDGATGGGGSGAGGAGTGGNGTGGQGTGGNGTGGPCMAATDCGATEYCMFGDGLCGRGVAGTCAPRPEFCSDGIPTCFCSGSTSDLPCRGNNGSDFDYEGISCTTPQNTLPCGQLYCPVETDRYCQITSDDTGGPPAADCGFSQNCDPATCACLTVEIAACGGTCVDSANGPTISCPGG